MMKDYVRREELRKRRLVWPTAIAQHDIKRRDIVRRLLIAPAILLIMSAGFIARTSPAHGYATGTYIVASTINWNCNVGGGDTDAGPFEFGIITDSWHPNGRDFTFLYNCPVTATVGYLGASQAIVGAGRAYGVGVISAGGGFHTTAHVSIVGTLDGIWFDSYAWNQYMVETDFNTSDPLDWGIAQNGGITSFSGGFTHFRGTGNVLSTSYFTGSIDGVNTDYFQLGRG
jgi:hypothetical protein